MILSGDLVGDGDYPGMNHSLNRRRLLETALAGSLLAVSRPSTQAGAEEHEASPIVSENAEQGTREWLLNKTDIDPNTKYRSPRIEGYCSHASVSAGETLKIFVSARPAALCQIDIYRMGYYGGDGGRHRISLGPFACFSQPEPEVGPKRIRNCQWTPTAEITIPHDWTSGVYVGKLTEIQEQHQSYVIFIVKDERRADFVFQCSDHTWQAYNRWPSQYALYDDGKSEWYWGGNVQVSFNRPYGKYCQILDQPLSLGSGEFFLWEFPFLHWLESEGYNVTYQSNQDTHFFGPGEKRAAGFLSIGHDEYWSAEMYDHVKLAIEQGMSCAFFSGNAVCGKIAIDPVLRAFERVGVFGPPGGTHEFDSMNSLPHEPPYANALIGAHSTGPVTGGADWICSQPDHWLYRNTGMKLGDRIPGLIGWEWHGDPAEIPGIEIVATGPTQAAPGQLNGGTYTSTVYRAPKGNTVFNAATCWWADGLSAPPGYVRPQVYTSPQGVDERVRQITRNVLRELISSNRCGL